MKNLIVLIFSILSITAFAQPEGAKVETVNGERVYVHVVQNGNTLWGIHQLYNVPVETIVIRNPGIDGGIKEGEVVYIPVPKVNETKKHIVQSGETLFGIARKYSVSVEDLQKWNPELKNGLKADQELIIQLSGYANDKPVVSTPEVKNPSKETISVTFQDNVVEHIVQDNETFYSISKRYMVSPDVLMEFNGKRNTKIKPGDVLKVPIKKEKIERVVVREVPPVTTQKIDTNLLFKRKEDNSVAILLPFFLDRGAGYSEVVSNMAAEFYMGAQMALDSLKSLGFNAKIYVYDTENDSTKIASILAKPEFKTMDLVIGPLYKGNVMQVATWCKNNQVRMVCPGSVDMKVVQNNPMVYSCVASDQTLMKSLANYTYTYHKNDKLLLIKPTKPTDSLLYEAFRDEYNLLVSKGGGSKLVESTPGGFTSHLVRTDLVLIFPTNDKASAVRFFNELGRFSHKVSEEKTFVFGTNEWAGFEGLNSNSKNKFKLTYAEAMNFNYAEPKIKYYTRQYRRRFKSDFTKMAAQGFDATFNFCAELLMEIPVKELVMNDFKCKQVGPSHGFENKNYYILSQRGYELVNVTNQK